MEHGHGRGGRRHGHPPEVCDVGEKTLLVWSIGTVTPTRTICFRGLMTPVSPSSRTLFYR